MSVLPKGVSGYDSAAVLAATVSAQGEYAGYQVSKQVSQFFFGQIGGWGFLIKW